MKAREQRQFDDAPPRIDPQLDALLEEALAPPPADPQTVDRIYRRTVRQVRHRPVQGVLVRLDTSRFRAMAAAIIIAATVGIVLISGSIVAEAREIIVVRDELQAIMRYEPPSDSIDQELEMLSLQIEQQMQDARWEQYMGDWSGRSTDPGLDRLIDSAESVF